ncbi:TIR domain-containing protein [Hymenobacter negativus]|uniref:Nucleoside 2-deoxyribosyltransferase n=1 Tax=Hymenobacter negativus TaxID=2795026 RepID=A0ABS0QB89_9BACT|nr:hypothetical protein [Hymenobacter negativus]MBH8559862.1 hypothetical protein [Hymenobacter negativus]
MPEILCPLSGLAISDLNRNYDFQKGLWSYLLSVDGSSYFQYIVEQDAFTGRWDTDEWWRRNQHLVASALKNGLRLFEPKEEITLSLVRQRLMSSTVPHTPQMKLDWLLKHINDKAESPGNKVEFDAGSHGNTIRLQKQVQGLYIKDVTEFEFYLSSLKAKGLITLHHSGTYFYAGLTFDGLIYLGSLEREGSSSKNCFVAMSFADDRKEARAAIERAIQTAGYEPVMIDTRHIDSDKTINDRIIAEIRACKFCVSDFTGQRNGIYFEAGFALGLGKPIIYACETQDFLANSHFDLKPFQHILYNSEHELETQLQAKIAAWIQ